MFGLAKSRTIRINGRKFVIFGLKNDVYFTRMKRKRKENDFLTYVTNNVLDQESIVLDVGANIGVTAILFASRISSGKVHAFEPSPAAYPLLAQTIAANKLERVVPYQLACGAERGELSFFDNPQSASASHLVLSNRALGASNATVQVVKIDDFVGENTFGRLDLIKIDVEGLELDVLRGAENTISTFKTNVFMEFNSFALIAFGNQNPRTLLETLLARFPHVYRFEGGKPIEIRDENSVLTFIHDNLLKRRAVDDLFCSHSPVG